MRLLLPRVKVSQLLKVQYLVCHIRIQVFSGRKCAGRGQHNKQLLLTNFWKESFHCARKSFTSMAIFSSPPVLRYMSVSFWARTLTEIQQNGCWWRSMWKQTQASGSGQAGGLARGWQIQKYWIYMTIYNYVESMSWSWIRCFLYHCWDLEYTAHNSMHCSQVLAPSSLKTKLKRNDMERNERDLKG